MNDCTMIYDGYKELFCHKKEKIGLLGGTFNPVHLGHVYMAKEILKEFSLDKIIFIPVGDPPHKEGNKIVNKEHRFAMLEIATADEKKFFVSRIELDRVGKTYTIDTMRQLKSEYDADFYFIIGADTLFELPTWKEYEEVFKITDFICISRPGYDEDKAQAYKKYYKERFSKDIRFSSSTGLDMSSEEIRAKLKNGESVKGFLDENVEYYIISNGLYR